jgi:hypothetical protein
MRIQREGAQLQIRGTWSAGPGDDQARFLADLRALRDSAAIGHDELAARAHYPSDVLKEAENGPSLPGLPILTAYVRACEGDVLDWEERWRRLNPGVADDPGLPVRPVGASAAAMAGARAGVSVAPPDVYDPELIKAALRGDQARTSQASRRNGDVGISVARDADRTDHDQPAESGVSLDGAAGWGTDSGWDQVADPGVTSANGNHLVDHSDRGPFEAALPGVPDPAEPEQTEDFAWLKKSTPDPRPAEAEPAWREQAESRFGWSQQEDAGLGSPTAASLAEPAPPEPAVGQTAQERTDFWTKPVASVPSDLQRPTAASRAEEPATGRASWPASTGTPAEAVHHEAAPLPGLSGPSGVAGLTQPHGSSVRSTAQAGVGDQNDRLKDRLFPVRVLVVVVIAALIGSALVLLLK